MRKSEEHPHHVTAASLYGLPFSNNIFGESTTSRKRPPIPLTPRAKKQKHSDSTASESISRDGLPDPDTHSGTPTEFLCELFEAMHGTKLKVRKASDLRNFFHSSTPEQVANYTTEIVMMVRENNLDGLRHVHQQDASKLHCTNQFGESLLNRTCRLGLEEIAMFLLEQVEVTVRISDDCGRNPLHDVCWNPSPQLGICEMLLQRDPSLLLVADQRGFTPFDYARSQHWPVWKRFLSDKRHLLENLQKDAATLERFIIKEEAS
jgi:hypothetical protein